MEHQPIYPPCTSPCPAALSLAEDVREIKQDVKTLLDREAKTTVNMEWVKGHIQSLWGVAGALALAIIGALFASFLSGCTKVDPVEPIPPSEALALRYVELEQRLLRQHLDGAGMVVSRWEDGRPEHLGDSLLWTALTIPAIGPRSAEYLWLALYDMLEGTGGSFVRFFPIPEEYIQKGDIVSLDGEIGVWSLFAHYCAEGDREVRRLWEAHYAYLEASDWTLAPGEERIPVGLRYVPKAITRCFGGRLEVGEKDLLRAELAAWVAGVVASKSACYRIHLAQLLTETLDDLGDGLGDRWRYELCHMTQGSGLPRTDWYCGRLDGTEYLLAWQPNRFEFDAQRCSWEEPDGKPGLETPGVDWLRLYQLARKGVQP